MIHTNDTNIEHNYHRYESCKYVKHLHFETPYQKVHQEFSHAYTYTIKKLWKLQAGLALGPTRKPVSSSGRSY